MTLVTYVNTSYTYKLFDPWLMLPFIVLKLLALPMARRVLPNENKNTSLNDSI